MVSNMSNSNDNCDFYFKTLLQYIRSGKRENINEKINFIYSQRPKSILTKFNQRTRDVLIALIILLVENPEKKPDDDLLKYLVQVLKDLPDAKWTDLTCSINSSLPIPETFTFLFNTGLTELANIHSTTCRNKIISTQSTLIHDLIKSLSSNTFITNLDVNKTCTIHLPILMGMLRSFGRITNTSVPIISQIFKNDSNNREQSQNPSNDSSIKIFPLTISFLNSTIKENFNLKTYLLNTIGSSYSLMHQQQQQHKSVKSSEQQQHYFKLHREEIKQICHYIKKLFTKSVINQISKCIAEYNNQADTAYGIKKSFMEILAFIAIVMFRDVLINQPNMGHLSIYREIKDIVQDFYKLELIALNDRDIDTEQLNNSAKYKSNSFISTTSRNNLTVLANAAAIELYFLCVEDEQDAEKLCTKCSEKFFITSSFKHIILLAPLLASCIQVLGKLATKYPNSAKLSVRYLTDFLIEPSPILFKLYKRNADKSSNTLKSQPVIFRHNDSERSNQSTLITFSKTQSIFEYLRDTAIECLCNSLNSCFQLDSECVKAVCTKLSSRLYIVETTDRQSILISNNGILALSRLAVNLNHIHGIQEGVLQIYHQKLFSPPSLLDQLIIQQFGRMIISSVSYSVYQDILNTLITITAETILSVYDLNVTTNADGASAVSSNGNNTKAAVSNGNSSSSSSNSKQKYKYVLDKIVGVLESVSANINGDTEMNEYLLKLLEVFCQIGVKVKEMNDKLIKNSIKAINAISSLGALIPVISVLIKRMPQDALIKNNQTKLIKFFRDFWFFAITFGFTDDQTNEWYKSVGLIATRSPLLLSKDHLKTDLHFNSAIRNNQVSQAELYEIRSTLSTIIDNPEAVRIISYLTFAQCSYLQSVFKLEVLRVQNTCDCTSFQYIFNYLEDATIQKDKSGLWLCIVYIAQKTFTIYLDVMYAQTKTVERDRDLERQVQFLLVRFNHINEKLRKLADILLAKLMERFPHLLWCEKTVRCIMDITELLSNSLNMDVNQVAPEFPVPNTSYKLKVLDTLNGRENIIRDFTSRCQNILQESLKFAPITTKSHIQNYMLQLQQNGSDVYNHYGVNMVLESVMQFSKPKSDTEYLDANTLTRRPDCMKRDFSSFIGKMNEKYTYIGIVRGLMSMRGHTDEKANCRDVVQILIDDLRHGYTTKNEKQLKDAMLKSVAFMTINKEHDREILHELSLCVVNLFTQQMLSVAIECWSWISSSRLDIESIMVEEMICAWQMTVDLKLGMFQENICEPNPLAPEEKDVLKPIPPDTDAHRIWINYFQERLDTAKYNNDLEIELFVNLMHKSLAFSIENRDFCINRHVSVVGLRFRFLVMGMSILQFGSIGNNTSKMILRERIYYAALDYFTTNPRTPTQSFGELREDIKYLMEFWNKIVAERKYIREENFAELTSGDGVSVNGVTNDGGTNSVIVGSASAIGQANSNTTQNVGGIGMANIGGPLMATASFLMDTAASTTTMTRNESTLLRHQMPPGWTNTLNSTKRSTTPAYTTAGSRLTLDSTQYQRYFKDNWKKRNLILFLLSHELDRLYTFYNPFNSPSLLFDRIDVAINHLKLSTPDKQWTENVRIAWSVSPTLAVFIPTRFPLDSVKKEIQRLVKCNSESVSHVQQACQYLATEENILNDSIELNNLLVWSRVPALIALSYFAKGNRGQSLAHPITAQFACKCLMTSKPEALIMYLPQLVQALRYDDFGYVREVIFWLAKHSQLLAHQLIWNMMTNVYRDQDGKVKDTQIGDLLESLIADIQNSLTGPEKEFFKREFDFFSEITNVSALIKDKPLGDERKKACEAVLKRIKLVSNCYLPSNPEAIVLQIIDGRPMQSAAKAPYLARFKVQRIRLSELERLGRTGGKIEMTPSLQYECACIFKVGDDVRQDMLALQIMQIFKNVFQQEGLELYLFPYRVIATKPGCGVIECVPNSSSRDELGRQTATDLYQYFLDKYGSPDTSEFQRARRNFIMSMAGYSLFMFLIQIKDRHNGNLMLDKDGHIIHIDFGFMIESSPGGNIGFEPDMKITTEMGLIMGRDLNSQSFLWFAELCIKGYLAIRPYREQICTLVALMLDTGLPCFRARPIESLRSRFLPTSNEREAATYMQSIINKCYNNWRTNAYDGIQSMQNQIYK